jgi:hypothetical protein
VQVACNLAPARSSMLHVSYCVKFKDSSGKLVAVDEP